MDRGIEVGKDKRTISIEHELWLEASHAALDRGIDFSDLVELALKKELRKA